jgi:hypothetical protein
MFLYFGLPCVVPSPAEAQSQAVAQPDQPGRVDLAHPFAIQIGVTQQPINLRTHPDLQRLGAYRLYQIRHEESGRVSYRLRVGFFPTRQAAETVAAQLRARYPNLWIEQVSASERFQAAQHGVGARVTASSPGAATAQAAAKPGPAPRQQAAIAPPSGRAAPPVAPPRTAAQAAQPAPPAAQAKAPPRAGAATAGTQVARGVDATEIIQAGNEAMTAGNFQRAVLLYTQAVQTGRPQDRQQAQEFLALAYERNNQKAQAIAEYEEYLRRYPDGEAGDRVRQRLAGLLTATAKAPERLRRTDTVEVKDWNWRLNGSVAQYYDRHESFNEVTGRRVDQSALDNFLDLNTGLSHDRFVSNFRFSGTYTADFLEDGPGDVGRISALYGDANATDLGLYTRLGRQTRSSGGVLGRFDGAHVRYTFDPQLKLNLVGGFPVTQTRDLFINDDTYFYGVSVDVGPFDRRWDGNVFAINQESHGLTDRRGVGGELRYFDDSRNAVSFVDYDIYFSELNTAAFSGTWTFENQATATIAADYRRSPILSINDALIGQTATTVSDLLGTFTADELRQLALDRSTISRSATVGGSYPLNTTFQIGADVTASKISGTIPSGGVEGLPGTDLEWYYSAQLTGTSMIKDGDVGTIGLRYSDATSNDRYTLQLNTRYPVDEALRVGPRVRLDYRKNKNNQDETLSAIPSVRFNYILRRDVQLELEVGGDWSKTETNGVSDTTLGYLIFGGYRLDF